jgi:hypothetical protein
LQFTRSSQNVVKAEKILETEEKGADFKQLSQKAIILEMIEDFFHKKGLSVAKLKAQSFASA